MTSHILDTLSLGKIVQIRERLLKAQAGGAKVFRFESGDPNFSVAPSVLSALQKAAAEGKTHYVPNAGIPELRKALRDKLARRNNIDLPSEENVFVTNGAMHALFVTFQSLLDEGDEVIVPDPMWTEVVENVKLARGRPVPVPLRSQDGFRYDAHAIEQRVGPRTRAIFLNTPHNPTGAVLNRQALERIADVARRHGLWVVSDEAYEDVIFAPHSHHSFAAVAPDLAERTISVFSFSKSHAMSGLRVGYLVTRAPHLMDRLQKILRCSINGVNSVGQWTALAAVTGDEAYLGSMRSEYEMRRRTLMNALSGIPGVKPFEPQGTFFVWAELEPELYARLGVRDADGLSTLLAEKGVGSAPGDAFGESCAHAIRFAFSCGTPMVEEGARVLRGLLQG